MDASQLTRIRMEKAQLYVSRNKPVDSSLQTYRTMLTAASGGCTTPNNSTVGFVEQCPSPTAVPVGVTMRDGVVLAREYRTKTQEDHLRLGSQGSGSAVTSCDSVALRNAGRAECSGPSRTSTVRGISYTTPGCGTATSAVYYEPGSYDLAHPDPNLLVPAPCGIKGAELQRTIKAPCAPVDTPLYINGAWTHQTKTEAVYPLPPSA
jgi:hypothetical protein